MSIAFASGTLPRTKSFRFWMCTPRDRARRTQPIAITAAERTPKYSATGPPSCVPKASMRGMELLFKAVSVALVCARLPPAPAGDLAATSDRRPAAPPRATLRCSRGAPEASSGATFSRGALRGSSPVAVISVPSMVPVPESDGSSGRPVIAASAEQKTGFRANGSFDDRRSARADERERLRRHQRQIEACRGVALARRKRVRVVRPSALAVREGADAGCEGGKRHDAIGEHAVDIGGARRRRVAFRQALEIASAHEAPAGDRIAEGADIGKRVSFRVEMLDVAAGREEDHPGAGGDDGEGRRPLLQVRQERSARNRGCRNGSQLTDRAQASWRAPAGSARGSRRRSEAAPASAPSRGA